MVMLSDKNILQYCHPREKTDILERTGDTPIDNLIGFLPTDRLSVKKDIPFRNRIHACDQVENRCFTGAVWPDDTEYFPFLHMEGHIRYRRKTAETLHHILHFKKHHFSPPSTGTAFFLLKSEPIHFTAS